MHAQLTFSALLLPLLAACAGGDVATYGACEDGSDCVADVDSCLHVLLTLTDGSPAEGRLCSRDCASDADCPGAGACLALEADPERSFVCWVRCAAPEDCGPGFGCTTVEGAPGIEAVCLPE